MKRVAFFDINGTIIKRDDHTDIPFCRAVDIFLDRKDAMRGVDTSARSDKDVFIEVLGIHGREFNEEGWQNFLKLYEYQLKSFVNTDVWRENADAVSFIDKLRYEGWLLSLISGELSIGAEYKLKKIGVWDHFAFGAFGEDGLKRFDIAEKAMEKAKSCCDFNVEDAIVIGDTVLDIKTARHLGTKVVAIATGSHSYEKLESEKPDYLINKFCELDEKFFQI